MMRSVFRKIITFITAFLLSVSLLPEAGITKAAAAAFHLTGVTLKYGEETHDVFNDIFTVSNDVDENMHFDFSFDNDQVVYEIQLIAVMEDGKTERVGLSKGRAVHTVDFSSFELPAPSVLHAVIYDYFNDKVVDTVLGVKVVKSKTKMLFENDISIGPEQGLSIDMSSVAPGMHFDITMFSVPLTYKRYPEGYSVLGLGWNSTNQNFWTNAANGKFTKLAHGEIIKKWDDEYGKREISKFGLCWSVGGYAVSYDDNPNKMSGLIQFYFGTGMELAGQAMIFTYSITVNIGGEGDFTFTIEPAAPDPFTAKLDANFLAAVELYGGIGAGSLASIGIYGAAGLGAEMNVLPKFCLNQIYIQGEVGMKAKVLGRTILQFTFVKGRHDFLEHLEADGTEVYVSEINFRDEYRKYLEEAVQNGYGEDIYDVNEAEGETQWYLGGRLDEASEDEDDEEYGDRMQARKIAENIHPESGIRTAKLHNQNGSLILLVGNNPDKGSGNKAELQYILYDQDNQVISSPVPVCRDIDNDGTDDAGADYDPRLRRGADSGSMFAVWKRGKEDHSVSMTLKQAAENVMLCYGRYDEEAEEWTDLAVVSDDEQIIADGAVGFAMYREDLPYIFAYTNPADDPAGLSEESTHDILMFSRNEDGDWTQEVIESVTGRITSFDAGPYYMGNDFYASAVYALQKDDGRSVCVVRKPQTRDGNTKVVFENAFNAQFIENDEVQVLTFMEDGVIYFATGYRNNYKSRIFPEDESEVLPEASYRIIGDIVGSSLVAFLKADETSQNISGYVKDAAVSYEYFMVDLTDVPTSANVNYFDGEYSKNAENNFLVYSVQHYEDDFTDTSADLYLQAGEVNAHVTLDSAEVMNLDDLGSEEDTAEFSLIVRNNSISPIDTVSLYVKNPGEGDDAYTEIGTFDVSELLPGHSSEITFELTDDFTDPRELVFGAVGKNALYDRTALQSEILCEIKAGELHIEDAAYEFRDKTEDSYTVTVKSAGPGAKSGSVVFYNRETLEVYKTFDIENLPPQETVTFSLQTDHEGTYLDEAGYENIAVRVLGEEEELDESVPMNRYRQTEILPYWAFKKIPDDKIIHEDEEKTEPKNPDDIKPSPKPESDSRKPGQKQKSPDTSDPFHPERFMFILVISILMAGLAATLRLENR